MAELPSLSDYNALDLILALIVLLYALQGSRMGVMVSIVELAGFMLALLVGLWLYLPLSRLLVSWTPLPYGLAKPAAFVVLWVVSDVVYEALVRHSLPGGFWRSSANPVSRVLGLAPGAARGLLAATVLLVAATTIPFPEPLSVLLRESRVSKELLPRAAVLNHEFSQIFGDAVQETIGLLTVHPDSDERIQLNFKVQSPSVNETAESSMLILINRERSERGLPSLEMDPALRMVARSHSRDMFVRGYFGHLDPENMSPFDRMTQGGVRFRAAGENLALAPTVEVAHSGLMNSEGHRRNILNPFFVRVGIGTLDGGLHGKMFTQNFAD